MLIKTPSPLKGYVNLGDGIVLLSAWVLPLPYGIVAAGLGSALADLFSGYTVYAPATFVIKALMAAVPSLVNIPANAVQAVAGIIIGVVLITVFEKQNIIKLLK